MALHFSDFFCLRNVKEKKPGEIGGSTLSMAPFSRYYIMMACLVLAITGSMGS
jgi:hypothetical protein